jgi:nitrite reductase/ring-hydroxylating ferredoxin subunit
MASQAQQGMMMSDQERALCAARSNHVDYAARDAMHYLGNYERIIPANLTRMMENAHDWEHLPFVHASSFAGIDCLDQGPWGWRARLHLPQDKGGGTQLLDLIADNERHYWVSTVFYGIGEGIEIHTQATQYDDQHIKVDVGFYLPEAPPNEEMAAMVLSYMQSQYATLYDEDAALMQGRQAALGARKKRPAYKDELTEICLGPLSEFATDKAHHLDTPNGAVVLRHVDGHWTVHDAVCPHMLGPLEGDCLKDGVLICPWHGYRFDVESGKNLDDKCGGLRQYWRVDIVDNELRLVPNR